ncbi:ATP-binding cassette domain-containing protein [Desulfohalovibrio reitneri]|uniref:ATP-binding cassette domain-containing protein n=1 Tax=Desulfohalovibrio reitneri TaxID=1307759 RepID=UPI0004A780B3
MSRDDSIQLELRDVTKRFGSGPSATLAVNRADLRVRRGETLLLMGPSGSGKTTLLSMMGGILTPDSGRIMIAGQDITSLGRGRLAEVRLRHIGFIFQEYHLFHTLSVVQNLLVVLDLKGIRGRKAREIAEERLDWVGLSDKLSSYPAKLSGGQKQRLAVSRALCGEPEIILADEPTAALDSENGQRILDMLHRLTFELGRTLVVVTHDPRIRRYADRVVTIEDGKLSREQPLDAEGEP